MQFRQTRSIRRTLIFYFALFAFVPLAIVVFVALNAVNQSAQQQAGEQRNLAAEVKFSDIESWLNTAASTIELILVDPAQEQRVLSLVDTDSVLPSSSRPITVRNLERFLNQQLRSQNLFSRIFIYNLAGDIVVSTESANTETNIAASSYFDEIFQAETLIHPVSFVDGQAQFVLTTPILDENNFIVGNVAGELNLEALNAILSESLGASQTSEIYLVSSEGLLIAPPTANLSLGMTIGSEGIQNALAQENGVSNYNNYRGVNVVGAYRWLPSLNAALIAEIEESEALAVSTQIQALSLAVSVLAIGGVLFIGSLGAQQVTRPIGILTDTAAAVIAGDLNQRANVESRNEIGQLAHAFNEMTSRLKNLIDTLEQRVAERTKELEIASQKAEAASQAKSTFLSNMSHELRTPLNMVIGYTSSMLNMPQMYQGQSLPPIFREDVRLIQQSGQHLLGLINDILDLSKIEAGKFSLIIAETDLIEIFQGVVATSIGLVNNKSIQLRADYPNDLPHVLGDKTRIRQILLNLLSNAIKFTDTGVVTLYARREEDSVYIAVRDTGAGIPKSAIASIFDRFEQAKQDPSIQGTGLGLDISQRLAEMHGSHIEIESEVGKGSTFSFRLPISVTQSETRSGDERVIQAIETMQADEVETHYVLLFAETSAESRQHVHNLLEPHHYVIVDVQEDDDILEYALTLEPDAILLGESFSAQLDLIKELRKSSESLPIFVLSQENLEYPLSVKVLSPKLEIAGLLEQLNDVLTKPIKEQ